MGTYVAVALVRVPFQQGEADGTCSTLKPPRTIRSGYIEAGSMAVLSHVRCNARGGDDSADEMSDVVVLPAAALVKKAATCIRAAQNIVYGAPPPWPYRADPV